MIIVFVITTSLKTYNYRGTMNVRLNLSEGRPVSVIFENQRPVRISKEAAIELSALLMKAVSKIESEEDRDIEVANTDLENWKKGLSHFTKSMSKQTSETNEYPNEYRC